MKATVSQPESWKRVVDIEIEVDAVEKAIAEKMAEVRRKADLPGFRQGKVPVAMVKQRYGTAIRAEVIETLINDSFKSACKDNNILPINEGRLSNVKVDEGAPVSFSIEVEVDAPCEIKGYDKLKIKAEPKKIKDGDINEALESLRERLAAFTPIDRETKKGDYIRFEYEMLSVDGTERKDVKSPEYPVEVGASKLKEFDKAVVGSKAGDSVQFSLKFPKDYGDADLAGKEAEMCIGIKEVLQKNLPEMNEEFFRKFGIASEDELRVKMREDLESREKERVKNEAYNKAIDKLIESNTIDIPPSQLKQYLRYMAEEAKKYQRNGAPEPTAEEFEKQYKEHAERTIKRYKIIDFIAVNEKIKATQQEVDDQIRKIAEQYNENFDKLKELLRKDGTTNRIRMDLREQHTLDFLIGEYVPAQAE